MKNAKTTSLWEPKLSTPSIGPQGFIQKGRVGLWPKPVVHELLDEGKVTLRFYTVLDKTLRKAAALTHDVNAFDIPAGPPPWSAAGNPLLARHLKSHLDSWLTSRMQQGADERPQLEALQAKIDLLERQLSCDRPYLKLYRTGAAALLGSVISIAAWYLLGVGVPFHPIFAFMLAPVAVGVMAMAFLIKPKSTDGVAGREESTPFRNHSLQRSSSDSPRA